MKKILAVIAVTCVIGVQPSNASWTDPTRPPDFVLNSEITSAIEDDGSEISTLPKWRLSSVLIDNRRKVAVVNDELVHEGDSINGARVVGISPGSVRLENAAKVIELSLTTAIIKRLVGR